MEEILTIIGIIFIIGGDKTIYSIIYVIMFIITLAFSLFNIKLYFISYTMIIIYLSALTILFLFVIMLLQPSSHFHTSFYPVYFYIFFTLALAILIFNSTENVNYTEIYIQNDIVKTIGLLLYEYPISIIYFIFVTLILFVALLGILYLLYTI